MREAKTDLKGAEVLGQNGLYAMACFHCQQAVEKALKALMRNQGKMVPKTHSIAELAEKSGVFGDFRDVAGAFDTDYALTRYVDATGKPIQELYDSKTFAHRFESATDALKKVRQWTKN